MATLAQIWRHPIKGVGAERLERVTLSPGTTLPFDRHWAIAQEGAAFDETAPGWVPCRNFIRGAKAASLMAVTARMDGPTLTLRHPELPELTANPDDPADAARIVDWVRPIYPENRPAPERIVSAPGRGMTDSDFPSVAILSLSTLTALSQKVGQTLDPRRFRGNLWVEGTAPWEEFDWVGQTLRVGTSLLKVEERITRCRATEANPVTGRRDAATLDALADGWGHEDFGVYATVIEGSEIAVGAEVTLL
ncbi:MAG: MOSC domain-containing protein [Pseudomonadota bacterium]